MSIHIPLRRAARGVTLIELMVAMVLGLLVAGGIITLFLSTSNSNRVQTQLARMQEDGRFAIGKLTDDLSMANGLYCSNTGGVANNTSSQQQLDGLRTPRIFAKALLPSLFDNTSQWGATSGKVKYPDAPTAAYAMPSFMFMRGYNCTGTGACLPIPVTFLGGNLNTAGTQWGNRVMGTDVLTVRYLDSSRGWQLGDTSKANANAGDPKLKNIVLSPKAGEPNVNTFVHNLALMADCSSAQVFAVTGNGTATITPDPSSNFSAPVATVGQSARVFNFVDDMQTVTYYVQLVTDTNRPEGTKTGALMRRVNGTTVSVPDQELIRGVERLTFRYGVEDSNGNVRFLTADEVDKPSDATMRCPPTATTLTNNDPGCLWRAVKSIEVSLLLSSQMSMPNLTEPETSFLYTPDATTGNFTQVLPTEASATKLAIKPADQGFDNKRLRRQFTALVMLRNYNP